MHVTLFPLVIHIAGTNISPCCQVAVVSQDLELFSGSLRYNIEYGLKGCTIERVRDAATKANAEAIIPELKNEYDKGTNARCTFCRSVTFNESFRLVDL